MKEWVPLLAHNYCKVFVLPNPGDATEIWGFYTLSPTCLPRTNASGSDQKRIPGGIPVPMMLLGFMGKSDSAPQGLGSSLIIDAARRIYQDDELAAWGLMLAAEGGPDTKLWEWYKKQGFKQIKVTATSDTPPEVMYAPFKHLLPELKTP
jgi:hypothetical protein